MWLLSFLIGCAPDTMLHYDKVEEIVVEEITEEVIAENIWVDSFYQPIISNGIDILWVIDGSGSMSDDKERVLLGIEAMMNSLPASGWRLAMISTDENGSLLEQQFPLVPGDTYTEAEEMYIRINHGWLEAGLDSVFSYMVLGSYADTWMRKDAGLLVVFVSDEDDQSSNFFYTQDFIEWVARERNNVYMSSIVNLPPDESSCNHSINWAGSRYIEVTEFFSGNVIDICSEDWTAGVAAASEQMVPKESLQLTYEPLDPKHLTVFVNGKVYTDWTFDDAKNIVYFSVIPPEGALVEIAYYYDGDTAI